MRARVLVVDDSVVARKLVSDSLASSEQLEVVGSASDGLLALKRIEQLTPDIITLDMEMPNLDGLETLRQIRARYPVLPVVMVSSLTERGARQTLDALALGANDYVAKPSGGGSIEANRLQLERDLIPKLLALTGRVAKPSDTRRALAPSIRATQPSAPSVRPVPEKTLAPFFVLISSSTGGPNALAEVFKSLPTTLPVPILITQHMPPVFTRMLAERLTSVGTIPVEEGEDGKEIRPGRAYIAPGDYHQEVSIDDRKFRIRLTQTPPENSCRPAADVMLRSAVAALGGNILSVVLTGMGSDGMLGSQLVREKGGCVVAQDQETSVVWGMPGAVAAAGLAHAIVPLSHVGIEIGARVSREEGIIRSFWSARSR